ncbi:MULTISPECIES: hypothetical protein [unclassified Microbacterium]|uniref:hypothetical protein n=1 Tax=unclassified Microbacterium TaxID=2609290 RepID=UPI00214BCA7D|nr:MULTISPECIES: hypothetical protein [unclassified Microbacterium]MCR2783771.1 hypothetical protein [Microbacterium sp. zg.B96]WIM15377.1 hypothetical protein QNO11_12640 [Microbacterium sp. zg-B96]
MGDELAVEITEWQLLTYLGELEHQAEAAAMAIDAFNGAMQTSALESIARAFAAAQSLLGAAAQISKLLWPAPPMPRSSDPQRARKKAIRQFSLNRGARLCEALQLQPSHGLVLKDRNVRNAFEHFDERLDAYFFGGGSYVVDRTIGPRESAVIVGDQPAMYLRLIDNAKLSISVLDVEVSLQAIADDVMKVREAAEKARTRLQANAARVQS